MYSIVSADMPGGIWPVRLFECISRNCSPLIKLREEGIEPESKLASRYITETDVKAPRDGGMVPCRELLPIDRSRKDIMAPMLDGIVPAILLLRIRRYTSDVNALTLEGIVPAR